MPTITSTNSGSGLDVRNLVDQLVAAESDPVTSRLDRKEINIQQEQIANDRKRLSQQVEIEVTQIFYTLQYLQLKMEAEVAAVKSSQKSYNVIHTKYKNDKAILIELLQAQKSLTTSELSQALTKYDYLIQLALLEKTIE